MGKYGMNAQVIYQYMRETSGFGLIDPKGITPESVDPFQRLFETMKVVEPLTSGKRFLWIKASRGSFEEFFESHKDRYIYMDPKTMKWNTQPDLVKMERDWPLLYPDEEVWYGLKLHEIGEHRAVFLNEQLLAFIPAESENNDKHEKVDLRPLLAWMQEEAERCIEMLREGTYMDYVQRNLPYYGREGYISAKKYWELVPDDFEKTYGKVNKAEMAEFLQWVDDNCDKEFGLKHYTSGDYFWAGRQYYEVVGKLKEEDEGKTDRELYIKYADGRDGGLRDLTLDSPEEFSKWFHDRLYEHHAWELDYAHKWLRVNEEDGKYYLSLELYFDHDTAKLIPIVLQLVKRGVPIWAGWYKSLAVKLRGDGTVAICSLLGGFGDILPDKALDERIRRKVTEERLLGKDPSDELISAIEWEELPQVKLANKRE